MLHHNKNKRKLSNVLTVDESLLLQRFYVSKIQQICQHKKYIFPVLTSSIEIFIKYTSLFPVEDIDLKHTMMASIFLSLKVHNKHIDIKELCYKLGKLNTSLIIETEKRILLEIFLVCNFMDYNSIILGSFVLNLIDKNIIKNIKDKLLWTFCRLPNITDSLCNEKELVFYCEWKVIREMEKDTPLTNQNTSISSVNQVDDENTTDGPNNLVEKAFMNAISCIDKERDFESCFQLIDKEIEETGELDMDELKRIDMKVKKN
eukprot:GHVP01068381.1.p1 GENE.GHVP01068381.1~~GHVP01068381.1.p1  ORF type:complete len:261 (+),score=34.34 GHVP01068381.1:537-1319(+)